MYCKIAPASNSKKRFLEDDESTLTNNPSRKSKPSNLEYFQVEDEFIEPLCDYFDYQLPNQQVSDSRRVFDPNHGVVQSRRVFLMKITKDLKN